ncbi:MAG TPA: response regulator transcription factor [Puia sp.]|uniref:response regulator transcription factor n=1 Tax=Puia sp. TaxID=2045100 RepID=UPI002B87D01D|nr:response regulator transcription factor [Puia sp.]HVU95442.1 response regulator transcription factor [Puia sp.]
MKLTVGIADDHQLFLHSLSMLISGFPGVEVVLEALQGDHLLQKLAPLPEKPDILLIDVNMPVMDGPHAAEKIAAAYPAIKMVALSMKDDDTSVISMLRAGCCAYLLKDMHPAELEKALVEVHSRGFYNADAYNINYRRLILKTAEDEALSISDRERQFLQLACSDLTYKEIASRMYLSERTIDGYRESLFEKLNVKSRVGMALEAIRRDLVRLGQR